ncbi:MAG TPA: 3-deoxy-manno-octulosonate cytidylyltransferase, partial [candidate division Zixibacteria bacterium]|nr:3-deoxy-manno-octulosonate cytidylyltransferase [candidate division Zixibacteria bacterium]
MARKRRIRSSEVVGVIPARWGSTRFPGKILTPIGKSPLLAHVIRGCRKSRRVSEWLVATDD